MPQVVVVLAEGIPTANGYRKSFMRILKLISLTIIQLVKQAWMLPQSIPAFFSRRGQRAELNQMEAERLDRLRHPSDYLGK